MVLTTEVEDRAATYHPYIRLQTRTNTHAVFNETLDNCYNQRGSSPNAEVIY